MEIILRFLEKYIIPKKLYAWGQPIYHYALALLGAILFLFPSRKINVIAVTGTKGKTSVVEITGAILEEAGFKVALSSTLRFKIGDKSERNMYKMTIPGRFFLQKFLRRAVRTKCQYAVVEMTSEGARQFRHKFIAFDALIFTNLAKEHIESHGSYEKYVEAKLKIASALEKSKKKRKILVVNTDDAEASKFLMINIDEKYKYALNDAEPYTLLKEGLQMTIAGQTIKSKLSGKFNIYNMLAALTYAKTQNIGPAIIKNALEKFEGIRGRVERIEEGQDFTVIVDYAHTPDSLEKLYEAFQNQKKICVLGNTGGGRDKWKREAMAEIAEKHCSEIILTNEDPYDEDPRQIAEAMANAIKETPADIIMDRREAINKALSSAGTGDAVLITGKGTDPFIMGPNGAKTPWDDATVTREELKKILKK
ncbi:MAG TPA: UDP-N-acetylmuramyl-tripeptide synthetase [Candidatus Paceibacterota bacterium]